MIPFLGSLVVFVVSTLVLVVILGFDALRSNPLSIPFMLLAAMAGAFLGGLLKVRQSLVCTQNKQSECFDQVRSFQKFHNYFLGSSIASQVRAILQSKAGVVKVVADRLDRLVRHGMEGSNSSRPSGPPPTAADMFEELEFCQRNLDRFATEFRSCLDSARFGNREFHLGADLSSDDWRFYLPDDSLVSEYVDSTVGYEEAQPIEPDLHEEV